MERFSLSAEEKFGVGICRHRYGNQIIGYLSGVKDVTTMKTDLVKEELYNSVTNNAITFKESILLSLKDTRVRKEQWEEESILDCFYRAKKGRDGRLISDKTRVNKLQYLLKRYEMPRQRLLREFDMRLESFVQLVLNEKYEEALSEIRNGMSIYAAYYESVKLSFES